MNALANRVILEITSIFDMLIVHTDPVAGQALLDGLLNLDTIVGNVGEGEGHQQQLVHLEVVVDEVDQHAKDGLATLTPNVEGNGGFQVALYVILVL